MHKEVPPSGPLTARIAIVGEAPGTIEENRGQPFIGPSGRKLSSLLASAGLNRDDIYITNVFKHNPGAISKHLKENKDGIWASPEAIEAANLLREELSNTNAYVIIPMGNLALWALTGEMGVSKWRGSILDRGEWRIIPTYHPSYLLRNAKLEFLTIFDLKRVKWEEENRLPIPQRTLHTSPSFREIMEYIAKCRAGGRVGFDIETGKNPRTGWEITCFALALSPHDAMCIPLTKNRYTHYLTIEEEGEVMWGLAQILMDPNMVVVGQNFSFDLQFMITRYGIPPSCHIEDCIIAQRVLMPDYGMGLDMQTSIYTRTPFYKDDGKKYMKYNIGKDEAFWRYNALDAAIVLEIFSAQKGQLDKQGNWTTYERQRNIIKPLLFMSTHALSFNKELAEEEAIQVESELDHIRTILYEKCGPGFNPGSTKQVMEYFYDKCGIPPYRSKSGKPTCDETALLRIARKGYPEADLIIRYRGRQKYLSTYLRVTLDTDGRLRCSHKAYGTKTGRTSSSETIFDVGTNIQNFPNARNDKVRCYIEADPGHMMYAMDLSQAEGVLLDHFSNNQPFIDAFHAGADLHAMVASMISGLSVEEILSQKKAKIKAPLGKGDMTWRDWGKQVRLAFNYLMSADKFSLNTGLSVVKARSIRNKYFRKNQKLAAFQKATEIRGVTEGLRNPLGRYRRFHQYTRPAEIINHLPQSTVADVSHTAMNDIYNNLSDVILLNEIHDELLFEIPLTLPPEQHLTLLEKVHTYYSIPLTILGRQLTIPLEVKAGLNWGSLQPIELTIDSVRGLFNEKAAQLA